jgi:basic membrane lipoprotein Med (substrate-binding protein (PBP1-ABC) superfamily)
VRPRQRTGALAAAAAIAATLVLLAGCAGDDWSRPHPAPTAVGELKAGFEPSAPPSPEATINPTAGSWDDVHPSAGFRVVLLSTDENRPAKTLAASVRRWADAEGVSLREVKAGHDLIAAIVQAMDEKPDLIITVGDALVDPLATVTANHLDREFLVLGAEVAEPTHNVTSVDWTGAAFRGEGLGTSSHYDPATFTAARGDRAVRAGVAAVLHDLTGIVLWID